MVIVTMRIKVPNEQRKKFLDSARLIIGPTQVQPECISCRLYQELGNPDAVLIVEEWESRKGLDYHIKSDQYRTILSLMELSTNAPEIKFDTISKTEGTEVIEAVIVRYFGFYPP